jgi:FtsP/CotA-like multicopper oxidase with cupredoxin domain
MNRRQFLSTLGLATVAGAQSPPRPKADFTLRIGPVSVELAPKKIVRTIGYNGTSPGPLLRMPEGKSVTIDVINGTHDPEIVHWHGLHIPSAVDGSMEEGTPMVAPGATGSYTFMPAPSGTRWYHTHVSAGRNLKRGLYTGQFGFFYIDPKNDPGNYDKEVFLALREWDPYMTTGSDDEASMDAAWKLFSINDRALGAGEPVRVANGQRVLLRILNASATMHRRIAFAGHKFQVVALDGNSVSNLTTVDALELGPAERIDALVEMRNPGIWILGATDDHDRQQGMGIVFEYANQAGDARWLPPSVAPWDYTLFGRPPGFGKPPVENLPAERVPLVFEKLFAGHRWVDKWSINGKSYPKTDPIRVRANGRYRLVFDNRSDEAHPVHLHRHTFELTKVEGVVTSGVFKDVVVVRPKTQVEVDFVANNPGPSLFHCHQQMHMDYGFMTMMQYV